MCDKIIKIQELLNRRKGDEKRKNNYSYDYDNDCMFWHCIFDKIHSG